MKLLKVRAGNVARVTERTVLMSSGRTAVKPSFNVLDPQSEAHLLEGEAEGEETHFFRADADGNGDLVRPHASDSESRLVYPGPEHTLNRPPGGHMAGRDEPGGIRARDIWPRRDDGGLPGGLRDTDVGIVDRETGEAIDRNEPDSLVALLRLRMP